MPAARVSVVMSAFNAQPYLAAALDGVLGQTFRDFEFIIVDDGSTDNTWEMLGRYAEQDARIVILRNQPNRGVVAALNRGLEAAQGELIARQDADDISLPQRLARQVAFLDANPAYGLVGSTAQFIDRDGRFLNLGFTATQNEEIQASLLDHMCLCGPAILVRRTCLAQVGYYFSPGLDASEDYDLCLRLAEVTCLASLEEPVYLYRQHPASASIKREHMQAANKAIALERAVYRRFGPNPRVDLFATAARDYLRAAVLALLHDQTAGARRNLARGLAIYPGLLEVDQPLENLIRVNTPQDSLAAALSFRRSVFDDLLPHTRRLARLKSRLLSDLYMAEVFSQAKQGQIRQARRHLWPGVRRNPGWLLNRGVVSLLVKSLVAHP